MATLHLMGFVPQAMCGHDLLLAIRDELDGEEWTNETLDRIAAMMVASGYRIRDLDDVDYEVER